MAQAADCYNLGRRNERPPSPTYPIGQTPSSAAQGEARKSGPYRAPQRAPEKINLPRFTASSAKPRLQGLPPPSLPLCCSQHPSFHLSKVSSLLLHSMSLSSHRILLRYPPLAVMSRPPNCRVVSCPVWFWSSESSFGSRPKGPIIKRNPQEAETCSSWWGVT